jgi:dTDP-4-dehydrorhamnose 3,5-epimerase-like enzyme
MASKFPGGHVPAVVDTIYDPEPEYRDRRVKNPPLGIDWPTASVPPPYDQV